MQKRPITVLAVESEPSVNPELRERLEGASPLAMQIEVADHLSEAFARLSTGGVDVVLLDLDLPDSQGVVTFERMHAFAPDVPVVVLTARKSEALGLQTIRGGAQDHLDRSEATPLLTGKALQYAVERQRLVTALKSLSLMDELTDLYNAHGFRSVGKHYLRRAERSSQEAALIVVDIDGFKTINDSFGHHVGDRALVEVGHVLRTTFRASDIIARLEADLFAVLAPDASSEGSERLLQRIEEVLGRFNTSTSEPYRLSLSYGVARREEGEEPSLDRLLEAARSDVATRRRRERMTGR